MVDCYSEPLLFVEASAMRPWQILHANDPALRITGLDKASIAGQPFWQIFAMRDSKVCPCAVGCYMIGVLEAITASFMRGTLSWMLSATSWLTAFFFLNEALES